MEGRKQSIVTIYSVQLPKKRDGTERKEECRRATLISKENNTTVMNINRHPKTDI